MPVLAIKHTTLRYERIKTIVVLLIFMISFAAFLLFGIFSPARNPDFKGEDTTLYLSFWLMLAIFVWFLWQTWKTWKIDSHISLISLSSEHTLHYHGIPYEVAVVIQLPSKPEDPQKPDSPRFIDPVHRKRTHADIQAALYKFFETLSSYPAPSNLKLDPPAIPSTLVEQVLAPTIRFLQQSLTIPLIKFDCLYVRPKISPRSDTPPPDPFMPIGRTL